MVIEYAFLTTCLTNVMECSIKRQKSMYVPYAILTTWL